MLTIEGPQDDVEMSNTVTQTIVRDMSPPRTPVPTYRHDGASRRPDWSLPTKASKQYGDLYQRPSSALSNASDSSDDSFYSGSRLSRPSEDGTCTSPESELASPFGYPSISKARGKAFLRAPAPLISLNGQIRNKSRTNAPWSPAMDAHLWATYLLYLQDPTVTPFRMGTSSVPPEGVCHRVAREARRSWRGPRIIPVRRSARLISAASTHSPASDKSGSLTPTIETSKVYGQWPHSSGATRSHLRELCRSNGASLTSRHRHMQSPCPTPFTKSNKRDPEPARFQTRDMAMSLTTSIAETMQPNGPLAQLASERSPSPQPFLPKRRGKERYRGSRVKDDFLGHDFAGHDKSHTSCAFGSSASGPNNVASDLLGASRIAQSGFGESLNAEISRGVDAPRRLGSPCAFIAHTYGPSSSSRHLQPETLAENARPRLQSPVRLTSARSLNNTQKRRAQHSLDEELSPGGAVIRPSILDEQFFGMPLDNQRRVRSRGFSLGSEALRNEASDPFLEPPRSIVRPTTPTNQTPPHVPFPWMNSATAPKNLAPQTTMAPPTRLRSPFAESGPSSTFPRRVSQDATATIRRSGFATVHQSRRSVESFDFSNGPSLHSRLGDLDRRLQEIRNREASMERDN